MSLFLVRYARLLARLVSVVLGLYLFSRASGPYQPAGYLLALVPLPVVLFLGHRALKSEVYWILDNKLWLGTLALVATYPALLLGLVAVLPPGAYAVTAFFVILFVPAIVLFDVILDGLLTLGYPVETYQAVRQGVLAPGHYG